MSCSVVEDEDEADADAVLAVTDMMAASTVEWTSFTVAKSGTHSHSTNKHHLLMDHHALSVLQHAGCWCHVMNLKVCFALNWQGDKQHSTAHQATSLVHV